VSAREPEPEPPQPEPPRLFDVRMHDGSRHFGEHPETFGEPPDWLLLRAAVAALPGAIERDFVTDDVTEAWLDVEWRGESFSCNNQHGLWWWFVARPECPDDVLRAVLVHFAKALEPPWRTLLARGPVAAGTFRVLVDEPDAGAGGRQTVHDAADRAAADRYADDAAWEVEHGPVHARVFDDRLRCVHVGGQPSELAAHRDSSRHRAAVRASTLCGCFHCGETFPPAEVEDWTDDDQTALCPRCGVAAVLGDASGWPLTREFLGRMRARFF
jgi:hypothetical protein